MEDPLVAVAAAVGVRELPCLVCVYRVERRVDGDEDVFLFHNGRCRIVNFGSASG